MPNPAPIGIFDSGVGGLSVLRHLRRQLSHEGLIYVADQGHVPYGPRPLAEVYAFSEAITRFLLDQGAKLIVVACNTATAAALDDLRQAFPDVPFVGMEPAVKPGAEQTRSGRVGVLATAGTFVSQRYTDLMTRYASHVQLWENPCRGLVELIEAGRLSAPETEALLQDCLSPMLAAGVDTLVLGCTHYPFVMPLIRQIAGPEVAIIDPAPAVARQTARLLEQHGLQSDRQEPGDVQFYTTGDADRLQEQVEQLLGESWPVQALSWQEGPAGLQISS